MDLVQDSSTKEVSVKAGATKPHIVPVEWRMEAFGVHHHWWYSMR